MDSLLLPLLLIIPLVLLYFLSSPAPQIIKLPLPRGPKQFPVIGNLHLIGEHPHHDLSKLSRVYGPLMTLKLGQIMAIVISSPAVAKEALQKNDLLFSDRWVPDIAHVFGHADSSIIFSSPNKLWKQLRNISLAHVFSNKSLEANKSMRCQKLRELVDFFRAQAGQTVDVGQAGFTAFLSIISSSLFCDIKDLSSKAAREFRELLATLTELLGKPNIPDFFPLLRPFDLKGRRRSTMFYLKKLYSFLDEIIDGRRLKTAPTTTVAGKANFLDALLQLLDESQVERKAITTLLVV